MKCFLLNEQDTCEIYTAMENLVLTLTEILEKREIREEYDDINEEADDQHKKDKVDKCENVIF